MCRVRRASAGLAVVVVVAAGCGGDDVPDPVATDPVADPVAAAEALCPLMWTWVKDVGDAFNRAARDMPRIDSPEARRARWFEAFDEIDELNAGLLEAVVPLRDHPILGALVAEIEQDMPRAEAELGDIRQLFDDDPEVDERRHQERTQQVIVRMEKVIDLPKPSLAAVDSDGTLVAAFRAVPSCQHSIKDVDDGSTQSND